MEYGAGQCGIFFLVVILRPPVFFVH